MDESLPPIIKRLRELRDNSLSASGQQNSFCGDTSGNEMVSLQDWTVKYYEEGAIGANCTLQPINPDHTIQMVLISILSTDLNILYCTGATTLYLGGYKGVATTYTTLFDSHSQGCTVLSVVTGTVIYKGTSYNFCFTQNFQVC